MKVIAESSGVVVEFEKDGKAYVGKVTASYLRTKLGSYAHGSAAAFAECVNDAIARAVPVDPPQAEDEPAPDTKPAPPAPPPDFVKSEKSGASLPPMKPAARAKKGV